MKQQQCGVLGLLLLSMAGLAHGAAVIEDSLRQDDAHRVAVNDTREIKVILETNQADSAAAIVGSQVDARLQHRIGNRMQIGLRPGRVVALARRLPAGTLMRLPYPHQAHVVSQGVALTGGTDMHALNANGAGIKIGIIDLGFAGLSTAQAAGELPTNAVVTDYTGTGTGGINHGTQVAQIVYDMAPQAQLYLAKISTDVELQQAVNAMIAAGVTVINHSVGWYGAAFYDGTGPLCNIVNSAANSGIQWVNSAGNDRLRHFMGTLTDVNADLRHEFASGQNYDTLWIGAGVTVQLILNWDNYASGTIDYDLFLYNGNPDSGGSIVASSQSRQGSTYPYPYEALSYTASTAGTYYVVVTKRRSTTANVRLALFSLGADLSTRTVASSLAQPADCANALAVGATNLSDLPETYSAEGPTTDGRAKPELTGPDGVVTSLSSGFYGTSASAPHVTGAVAILAGQLAVPARQAATTLLTTLKDVNTVGFDYYTGYGRLSFDADRDGKNHDADNCPLVTNPDQADLDHDGIGNVCDDDADGDGLNTAAEQSAGTDPLNPDTDGDTLSDYSEVVTYHTNPLSLDTDGDGVSDADEIQVYGTNPRVSNKGDIAPGSGDGIVNVVDLLRLLRFTGGLEIPDAHSKVLADMNDDGVLDVRDTLALRRVLGY